MNGLVIDPRAAAKEVQFPVVLWQGAESAAPKGGAGHGAETWAGQSTQDASTPQVELRHELEDQVTMVVRLNIGDQAIDAKGRPLDAGVVFSRNESGVSIALSWREYYELLNAVDEGIEKLIALQKEFYARLGEKLSGGDRHDFGHELDDAE